MQIESRNGIPKRLPQPALCNLGTDLADDSVDLPARKLAMYLVSQIEFYLSDSNLIRDKFMRSKIAENRKGFIELAVLTKCNKIRQALESFQIPKTRYFEVLAEALAHSKVLKLNQLKNMVKRRTKFSDQLRSDEDAISNIDSRTVYVDNFPSTITEQDLYALFEKCGKIALISLPKYDSDSNKGHAFIEFVDSQGAHNALKLNNKAPEYLLSSGKVRGSNLRVIPRSKWSDLRQRLTQLKDRLRTDLSKSTYKNNVKNYVFRLALTQPDIVDESQVKLSLTQLDIFPARIQFSQARNEVTIRLTDFDQAQRLEQACYHRDELLSFVSKHRKLSDNELDGYLKAMKNRRALRIKKTQKSQNGTKRKAVKNSS